MINVYIDPYNLIFTVSGHSGKEGSSLVCAGASVLTYALVTYLVGLKDDGVDICSMRMEKGDAHIECNVTDKEQIPFVLNAFDVIKIGFSYLMVNYPSELDLHIATVGGLT